MRLYRIARKSFIDDLSGTGAMLAGGRWNRKGVRMCYASCGLGTAALEMLVHLPRSLYPDDLFYAEIEVDDACSLKVLRHDSLPDGWDRYPPPSSCAEIGSEWILSRESLLLKVPSAASPGECNVLINPSHREMSGIRIPRTGPYPYDPRLFAG
jgi:RES domain-containing protein